MGYIESTGSYKLITITSQNGENLFFCKNWLEQRGYEAFKADSENLFYVVQENKVSDFRVAYNLYNGNTTEEFWDKISKQLTSDYNEVADEISNLRIKISSSTSKTYRDEYDKFLQYYLGMSKVLTKYLLML